MGHRLRRGWRRALFWHLAGDYRKAQDCGFVYGDLRHLLRHHRVQPELALLLEAASDKLCKRLLSQSR
jgi:hypothetical protein